MTSRAVVTVGLLALALACSRKEARPSATEDRPSLAVPSGSPAAGSDETPHDDPDPRARGAGPITTVGALELLASARCERLATCGSVGPAGDYPDHKSCVRVGVQRHAQDIGLLQCSRGIDHYALSACVSKLREMSCNRRFAAAATICGERQMCLKE